MSAWLRGAVIGALTSFLLLTAAAGCVKVKLPRVGEELEHAHEQAAAAQAPLVNCDAYARLAPRGMKLSQYSSLKTAVSGLSEFATPERQRLAHAMALHRIVGEITSLLRRSDIRKARAFQQQVREQIRYDQPRWEGDLETLMRIGHIPEGDACSNLYLSRFYSSFVQSLDPFGTLEFLPEGAPIGSGAVDASVMLAPEGAGSEPRVTDAGDGVVVFSLRRWERSDDLTQAMRTVRERIESSIARVLVLDLRAAAGDDLDALELIRGYARAYWRDVPVVIWVDNQTRGTAELFATEFSYLNAARALTVGTRTFGYARKGCSGDYSLDSTSVRISLGCKPLAPVGGPSPDALGLKVDVPDLVPPGQQIPGDLELNQLRSIFEGRRAQPLYLADSVAIDPASNSALAPADVEARAARVHAIREANMASQISQLDQRVVDMAKMWLTR